MPVDWIIFTLLGSILPAEPGALRGSGGGWEKCQANADNRSSTNRPLIGRDTPGLHSKCQLCNRQLVT